MRALVFRFEAFGRPVRNMKKFEEGVFSDLRNLKPGVDACLEEPKVSLRARDKFYFCSIFGVVDRDGSSAGLYAPLSLGVARKASEHPSDTYCAKDLTMLRSLFSFLLYHSSTGYAGVGVTYSYLLRFIFPFPLLSLDFHLHHLHFAVLYHP